MLSSSFLLKVSSSSACRSLSSSSSSSTFDVLISGGGLVGSAAALGITAKKNLAEKRVLVLEAAETRSEGKPTSSSNNAFLTFFRKIRESRYILGSLRKVFRSF